MKKINQLLGPLEVGHEVGSALRHRNKIYSVASACLEMYLYRSVASSCPSFPVILARKFGPFPRFKKKLWRLNVSYNVNNLVLFIFSGQIFRRLAR